MILVSSAMRTQVLYTLAVKTMLLFFCIFKIKSPVWPELIQHSADSVAMRVVL